MDEPLDLRAHRAALLDAQGISAGDLAKRLGRAAVVRDLLLALAYSAYALPLGWFVIQEGAREKQLGTAAVVVAFAAVFFVLMWRSFTRSLREMKRTRTYEGVLRDVEGELALFDGGKVRVPPELESRLQPGVRYRVHAPDTEHVAIDVVIDEVDAQRGAYR